VDQIDKELSELYASVGTGILTRKAEQSLRRLRNGAARELNLKPGTKLAALAQRLEQHPELVPRFEVLSAHHMLLYCMATRVGQALIAETDNPRNVIADLIAKAALDPPKKGKRKTEK
jgi:hypothetical protein